MVINHASRRKAGAATVAAGLLASLTAVLTVTAPPASGMVMRSDRPEAANWIQRYNRRLTWLVNNQRSRHGLARTPATTCATSWARGWSGYLTAKDRFEHSNLGGLLDRCHAVYASENIAMIYDGARPRDLVRLWMASPGHRANILSRNAKLTGVSIRWDDDQHAWVAVQNFVRR